MSYKRAIVRMEERYMRLTIEYDNSSLKTKICSLVSNLENELKIYPEVIHKRGDNSDFFTSIEFSKDDYICSRTSGEFIDKVVKGLGIDKCE